MTRPAQAPAPDRAPQASGPVWHSLSADGVLQAEDVDARRGLSAAEAASRAQRFGPNKSDTGKAESRWHLKPNRADHVRLDN